MKPNWLTLCLAGLLMILAGHVLAQTQPKSDTASQIERGRYLVERVSICADCHTARDWKGKQDSESALQGARLDFKPGRIMPWAEVAPPIAGLPTFATDAQAVRYLETGINSNGKRSVPPMPQYRFDPADAAAVVAYLRSLKTARSPGVK
jgi:mono/diheme cytochrome c family protein